MCNFGLQGGSRIPLYFTDRAATGLASGDIHLSYVWTSQTRYAALRAVSFLRARLPPSRRESIPRIEAESATVLVQPASP